MITVVKFLLILSLSIGCWAGEESRTSSTFESEYHAFEVVDKSPSELVEIRGFRTETHYAITHDGYHIHCVRIINPYVEENEESLLKRPVIFNHGLLESGTIWLINSRDVQPRPPPNQCGLVSVNVSLTEGIDTLHMNAPFMLSNYGYDVWIMSMRGTDWSLGHEHLSPKDRKFWDYSLDDFALTDVPTVIDYVREVTGSLKVGYVGHSQATFAILGLLSVRTKYAKVVEPVVAVAPVSYFDHVTSVARVLMVGMKRTVESKLHGPFPRNAPEIRRLISEFCRAKSRNLSCQMLATFVAGPGKEMHQGFFGHLPFFTSIKVLRHFGQLIDQKRNLMYDYGREENIRHYGKPKSPNYPLERITSKSLCFFSTESDSLSAPKDIERLKKRLTVKLYSDVFIKGRYNHMDMVVDKEAIDLVNKPMLEIFESFELRSGVCSPYLRSRKPLSERQDRHEANKAAKQSEHNARLAAELEQTEASEAEERELAEAEEHVANERGVQT